MFPQTMMNFFRKSNNYEPLPGKDYRAAWRCGSIDLCTMISALVVAETVKAAPRYICYSAVQPLFPVPSIETG